MQLNSISLPLIKGQAIEIVLGVALLAICSQIIIPIKPIFISLQTVAVMFIGLTYNKTTAPLTILSFITLGVMGIPVFGEFSSGLRILFGPTGGYLAGFLLAIYVMASLKDKIFTSNKWLNQISLCLISNIIIMSFGWMWLSKFLGTSGAFYGGVLPFIIPGIIKSVLLIGLIDVVKPNTLGSNRNK
ncbi:MAG: biotin transporter BioY [Rickettsia endosymbiont of Ixodes persulcatus]|nr:biotin transporter BioY [Rickettsia endosymbiont of Ixodes persulcatus]MCZ6903362.1 biotin transporter BioY [Rickettsia endosymbiont of Ixodes persulcatus]MCZ6909310.1 biotin transporter BioY [Rickettsia endosymbiont of Ixodes persulcatus]MCZ6909875.1 biotin transporter BioY [Rickettsia endosymbiont of Ixodes persulcatus]MCZ6915072.1 biotin transporter BioY [Rickettsia endosymbiont of Ixodes persulcatus]